MLSTGTEIHHLGLLSDVYLKKYRKGWVMTGVNLGQIDPLAHFDLMTQKLKQKVTLDIVLRCFSSVSRASIR